MASRNTIDDILLMGAIKIAQPGILSDIVEAYSRLEPEGLENLPSKFDVRGHLNRLIAAKLVWLYAGRRYMLTKTGERYISTSGLRLDFDGRRLYLLKETRKHSVSTRSDARDRPQNQRS